MSRKLPYSPIAKAVMAVFALAPLTLMAEEQTPFTPNPAIASAQQFSLGTVKVYGETPTSAELSESFVDRDEILLLEKRDVGEALSLVPGVLYNRPTGNRYESDVLVRGFDLRSVPIFVDGIPVYIPYDGFSDLGRFTTADISSIDVAKGYSSVMYGHNTLGGAINVVSMRPKKEFDFDATLGLGSGDRRDLRLNAGTLQDRWYLQGGYSREKQKYQRVAENFKGKDAYGNIVDSDRYNYRTDDERISLKAGFTPNATDEYVLSYSKQMAKKASWNNRGHGFSPTEWQWPKWDRETISFVSNTRFYNDLFYLKPRIYYDRFKNTMDWWRGQPKGSHYDDRAFGASVEVGTEIVPNHLIKMMLSYKDEKHKSFDTEIPSGKEIANSNKSVDQQFYSIALEDTVTLNEQWELQVGGIYTKRKAGAKEIGENTANLLDQYPQAASMLNPTINTFDPQVALFYKPSDDHTFRASISRKTRFPSFKQVFSNYASGKDYCINGGKNCPPEERIPLLALQNPGLKPEKAMHYELGYFGSPLENLYLEGSLYFSQMKNTIDRTDEDLTSFPGFAVTQSVNLKGTTERKGIDLRADYQWQERLALGATYSYLHIQNREDKSYRFENIPKHFGTAYLSYTPIHWVNIVPSVEYRSNSFADSKGKNRNPGYALYNLKVAFTPPQLKGTTVNFAVDNIFNKNYQKYRDSYATPGRMMQMNVRIEL